MDGFTFSSLDVRMLLLSHHSHHIVAVGFLSSAMPPSALSSPLLDSSHLLCNLPHHSHWPLTMCPFIPLSHFHRCIPTFLPTHFSIKPLSSALQFEPQFYHCVFFIYVKRYPHLISIKFFNIFFLALFTQPHSFPLLLKLLPTLQVI